MTTATAATAESPIRRKVGRPSIYSRELADHICRRLSEGESLRGICADDDMPSREAVLDWIGARPDFHAKYARARENQAEWAHDEMLTIERQVLDGVLDPMAARVVLASKQWRASKLAPKKYGERLQTDSTTSVNVTLTKRLDISTLSTDQLDALEGALRATLAPPAKVIEHDDEG